MIIVADIAGQIGALMRIVDSVPKSEEFILLGDLVDRGNFSFEVIEWAMNTPRVISLLGNHEHMMLEHYRPTRGFGAYSDGIWEHNGGWATKNSYSRSGFKRPPEQHLDWLASLWPYWLSDDQKLFCSHAPLNKKYDLDSLPVHDNPMHPDFDLSLIWNRSEPSKRDFFQVFGHNSNWGLRRFEDWAVCLDQSQKGVLTAMHWPSREIIEKPYVETKPEFEL